VASILTGLFPFNHSVRLLLGQVLPQSIRTVAAYLKQWGYKTGGFPSVFVVKGESGLGRDFDVYDDCIEDGGKQSGRGPWRPGALTNKAVLEFVETHGNHPFFLFVHFFDTHEYPLRTPNSMNLYDGLISHVDQLIGKVVDVLKERGLWEDTAVLITSDHGECFSEKGFSGHGRDLYDPNLRVPLIIRAPGRILENSVVHSLVRSVDIAPTILHLVGQNGTFAKEFEMDGESLIPLASNECGGLISYAETSPVQLYTGNLREARQFQGPEMMCIRTSTWKYIVTNERLQNRLSRSKATWWRRLSPFRKDISEELFRVAKDPGESHNLAKTSPHQLSVMRGMLQEILASQRGAASQQFPTKTAAELSEIKEKLRELGYL
jgi:arylsulfatase A-like enzyme